MLNLINPGGEMKKWVCLQLLCLIVMVQPTLAQEVKARGSEAITMGANSNSASIGYWHKLTDANSLGGDFTIFYRDHNRDDSQSYQFSPGIKHYLAPEKAVSPYLYGAIIGRYGENSSDNTNSTWRSENYALGVQGGIGLEWFPVQRVSIAGHVGVIAEYEKNRSRNSSGINSFTSNDEGFTIGTINSGFLLNLYF
jgi:hypothetical protein